MEDKAGVGLLEQSSAQPGLFLLSPIEGLTSRNRHSFAVPQFPHQQDDMASPLLGTTSLDI